jgi:hypothetical protein
MEPIQFGASNRDGMRLRGMTAVIVCLAFMPLPASAASSMAPDAKARTQSNYGKLPLSFEDNQGQADAQVKFLARGHGYALFLTPGEAVLSLKKSQAQAGTPSPSKFSPSSPPNPKFSPSFPPDPKFSLSFPPNPKFSPSFLPNTKFSSSAETIGAVLRIQFIGANPAPRIVGKEALSGRVNYLVGQDPKQWLTGVQTYAKVAYEGLYPGVDLIYYGKQGQLEYDFVVAPGADPRQIKLAFRGADKIDISPAGELVLHTHSGLLRMHKPALYQEIGGIRKSIGGSYMLKDSQSLGFQVDSYDATKPLIIDPVLIYSTYLGGSGGDEGFGIAVDTRGQAYVTGQTTSANFPAADALQPAIGSTDGNLGDAFIAQFTADGSALRYSTYLGGAGNEIGFDIAVDRQGRAYVIGSTGSADFPVVNAVQPTFGGGFSDAFVVQLTADGSALRYATYLGGSADDQGSGIAVDRRGQVSVTGTTGSDDFPIMSALQPALIGSVDAFVAQLTADGGALRYATYLGGSERDEGLDITVDTQGRSYITGNTRSSDFPIEKALQPVFGGGPDDSFIAKFTADGSALSYSTYLGGNDGDSGSGIAVDQQGRAYVTGVTNSTNFPTVNALQPTLGGGGHHTDAYVAQLTANGEALRYATYLGGSGFEVGFGIAVDRWGQAYVAGWTELSDFPVVNAVQPTSGGQVDAFVAKLTPDGKALRYATYLGGRVDDLANGIAVDQQGQAYVTGRTSSNNFPTKDALQPTFRGGSSFFSDAFVTKIGN